MQRVLFFGLLIFAFSSNSYASNKPPEILYGPPPNWVIDIQPAAIDLV